jgi:hypothetical protein
MKSALFVINQIDRRTSRHDRSWHQDQQQRHAQQA